MDFRSILRKAALGIISVLGVGPLIAKAVEKWADRNGYLDDPAKGFHWLLTVIGSLTELWFFYPVVAFLCGLGIGLWTDALLKSMNDNRSTDMTLIGFDLLDLGDAIDRRRADFDPWPQCASDLVPRVQSLFYRLEKANYWAPTVDIMTLHDNGNLLSNYLAFVGRMLADGHYAEAKEAALSVQRNLDQTLAKLRAR